MAKKNQMAPDQRAKVSLCSYRLLPLQVPDRMQLRQTKGLSESDRQAVRESSR